MMIRICFFYSRSMKTTLLFVKLLLLLSAGGWWCCVLIEREQAAASRIRWRQLPLFFVQQNRLLLQVFRKLLVIITVQLVKLCPSQWTFFQREYFSLSLTPPHPTLLIIDQNRLWSSYPHPTHLPSLCSCSCRYRNRIGIEQTQRNKTVIEQ